VALVGGAGSGACGFGLASRASGGLGRHRPAQLCGSVRQRAGGADESGGNPVESRAFVNGRPCPFPEGGPGDEGKRRGEAPIGAPVRVMGRPFPSAEGTGPTARRPRCGDPHSACRRFAPSDGGTFPNGGRARAPPERWRLAHHDEPRSTTCMSCSAKAEHPVLTDVSDYWIARMRGR